MSLLRSARNMPWPSGVIPGNSSDSPTASSTSSTRMKRISLPGSRINRSTRSGTSTRALISDPSSRRNSTTMATARLGMNGNGCAGSIAIGVMTGSRRSINSCRSQERSSSVKASWPTMEIPSACRRFCKICPASLLSMNEPAGDLGDSIQLLLRGQVRLRSSPEPAGRQFLEAGDSHHVEFIEVAVGNRKEPNPLEERMARIAGLFENAFVEGEPRQLAIDVSLRRGGATIVRSGGRWSTANSAICALQSICSLGPMLPCQ